jgi:hypothetical protein
MKTIITSILPALLVLLASNATIAGNENSHPFTYKTKTIVADTLGLSVVPINLIDREDETYEDDIPFTTREITAGYLASNDPVNEPESYVDDIPFRTDSIASSYFPDKFTIIFYEPESYINDIPFDTEVVAGKYLSKAQNKFCCSANQF